MRLFNCVCSDCMVSHISRGNKCGSKTMGRLSATAVKAAKLPGRYGDGDGLYLLVSRAGAR